MLTNDKPYELPSIFGDALDPVLSKFESPEVIDLAYQEYLKSATKPLPAWTTPTDPENSNQGEPVPYYKFKDTAYQTPEQFKKSGDYKNWIPLLKKVRNPLEASIESSKRNYHSMELQKDIYNRRLSGQDWEDVAQQLKKEDLLNLVDPVDGVIPSTIGMLSGMFEVSKEEGAQGALIGAGVGVTAAAPTGEIAAPATGLVGLTIGYTVGTTLGWYKQGSGQISYELWKKGNTTKTAGVIADTAAIPYALIQILQLGRLVPEKFKSGVAKAGSDIVIDKWPQYFTKMVPTVAKRYTTEVGYQVLEEDLQDSFTNFANDLGDYLNGQGVPIDKKFVVDKAKELWENTKAYTKTFALLPIVATALNAYSDLNVTRTDFSKMRETGLTPEQAKNLVAPDVELDKQHKIDVLNKLASATPEEFNKAYDALNPEQQKELLNELHRSKQVLGVSKQSESGTPTQDDVDKAIASFSTMNEAKQISPIVLTQEQITNVENNINSRLQSEVSTVTNDTFKQANEFANTYNELDALPPDERDTNLGYQSYEGWSNSIKEVLNKEADRLGLEVSSDKASTTSSEYLTFTKDGEEVSTFRISDHPGTRGTFSAEINTDYEKDTKYFIKHLHEKMPVEVTMTPTEKVNEDKIVRKVVSRFPTKIKDTKSLETVGTLIAKDLQDSGFTKLDKPIIWDFKTDPNVMGVEGGQWVDEQGNLHIQITQGGKVSPGIPRATFATAGFPVGKPLRGTQALLKKAVVHELTHIEKPPFVPAGKKFKQIHHAEFAQTVNEAVDRLWGYKQGDKIIPGKIKADVYKLELPGEEGKTVKNHIADAISSGQEVDPDGTVKTPVTKEDAVQALKEMLMDATAATEERAAEVKLLRAKQYATLTSILNKYVSSSTYAKALGSLKDVHADISFDWSKPISDSVYEKLCEIISTRYRDSFRQLNTWKALNALRAGESITYNQKILLSGAFGITPSDIPSGNRKRSSWEWGIEAWNLSRMLLAGFFDNSMLLRQMFPALLDSPRIWAKSALMSTRAMFSPKYAESTMADIYTRPNFELYQIMDIHLTGQGMGVENTAETNIGGSFLQYIPHKPGESVTKKVLKSVFNVATSPYRAAMRGADIATNTFRVNLADFYINLNYGVLNAHSAEGQKQWKYLGNSINQLTGRTNMGKGPTLQKISAVLNPLMFSMQLQSSRVMLLATGAHATTERLLAAISGGKFEGKYSPAVRKAISNSFLKIATGILGSVLLAKLLWPDETGSDPEQSNFGKVKIGNTYYDLTAGFGQYVRFVAQMTTGKKRSVTGNRYAVGRSAIAEQFARSKAAPSLNIVWDFVTGRKVTGEPVEWSTKEAVGNNLWNYFGPMIMQDAVDVMNNDPYQTIPATLLSFGGMGVQSYPVMPSQQSVIMKKKLAIETFGKDWDEIGPALQKALYTIHPELEMQDRIVKATRNDWNSISLRTTESQLAGKEVMKDLPDNVQEELIGLNLTIGGLSRQVGSSSYFLNEDRFNKYKDMTAKILDSILPKIVQSAEYQSLDNESRYKIMDALIKKSKSVARQSILNDTSKQDMATIKEIKAYNASEKAKQ